MGTTLVVAVISGIFAIVVVIIRRWLEISATRPKAAVTFLDKVKIGHSALAGELGIKASAIDVATFKEHLWFWQAAKVDRLYNAILQEDQRTDSYRQKIKNLHAYISRFT